MPPFKALAGLSNIVLDYVTGQHETLPGPAATLAAIPQLPLNIVSDLGGVAKAALPYAVMTGDVEVIAATSAVVGSGKAADLLIDTYADQVNASARAFDESFGYFGSVNPVANYHPKRFDWADKTLTWLNNNTKPFLSP